MARRNRKGQFVKGSGGSRRRSSGGSTRIVRASAPNITIRAPSGGGVRRRRVRRRSSGGGRGGGILGRFGGRTGSRTAILLGSAALGYAAKEKWLEKIPLVGRAGPLTSFGLIGWGAEEILKLRLPPIVQDMITSALAISAFNFGLSGGQLVSGDAYELPGGAVVYD